MKINYCLPIIKQTKEEVLDIIEKNKQEYDYIEIWLDYIADVDDMFVKQLVTELQGKLILLFRRQMLETIRMDVQKRKNIILLLENSDVMLDLDIKTQQKELDFVKEHTHNVKLITSYHNYEETPATEELNTITAEMESYKPAIYKISTMCQTENDAVTLLQTLLTLKQQEKKYIVLGMSTKGSVTRIFGTLWGNEMIFAPKEKNEISAPGQLTKGELENIFTSLRAERSNLVDSNDVTSK